MKLTISKFVWFIEIIPRSLGIFAAWLVLPLILCICFEVVSRYFFGQPTEWSFEVCYMLTGTHFLLGLAYALRQKHHVRIDIFYHKMSVIGKKIIDVVAFGVFALPISLLLSISLFEYWSEAFLYRQRTGQSSWNPIVWPFRLIFLIAFLSLSLQLIAELLKVFSSPSDQESD